MERVLAVVLVGAALVTGLYWFDYYTGGQVRVVDARWYTAFEDSFPAADAWLAVTAFLAGIGLWRGARWGAPMGLLAGSAAIYLAGMDITFNVENGLYALAAQSEAMQAEIAINASSLLIGIATIGLCWHRVSRNIV